MAHSKFKFCILELSGIFFFYSNISNLHLVESANVELANTEVQLCYIWEMRQRSHGMSEYKGGEMEDGKILTHYGKKSTYRDV